MTTGQNSSAEEIVWYDDMIERSRQATKLTLNVLRLFSQKKKT